MKEKKYKTYVKQFKDLIYSQAYYFTGNTADAADITQEVLLKFWSSFDHLKQRSIKSWIMKVTKNQCIDFYRKKRELEPLHYTNPHDGSVVVHEQADSESSPEDNALKSDLRQQLEVAIQALPPTLKLVIILREIHHHKYEEIADILEIPLNSVKVYLHRARKILFQSLHQAGVYGENYELSAM